MGADAAPPGVPAPPAVRTEDLVVHHDGHRALEIDRWSVPRGALTAVIGPNGAGKSTLLDAVTGLVDPTRGLLEVLDGPPGGQPSRVAYVLQETRTDAAIPLTVTDVVRMGRYVLRGTWRPLRRPDHDAVERAMRRTGITSLADRRLTELSAGQRQRVHLAQGLAQEAELLLLDEPTTGLDAPSARRLREVLVEERDAGRTVVYTTHAVGEAAEADHVGLLAGRLVRAGPPAEVLRDDHLAAAYGEHVITPAGTAPPTGCHGRARPPPERRAEARQH